MCTQRFPFFLASRFLSECKLCREMMIDSPQLTAACSDYKTVIGSLSGMRKFRQSLAGTPGASCWQLWLAVEDFRNAISPQDATSIIRRISYMFIDDGAKYPLPSNVRSLIKLPRSNTVPEAGILNEAQAVALDTLRAYWLPRFLTTQDDSQTIESILEEELVVTCELELTRLLTQEQPDSSKATSALLPSIHASAPAVRPVSFVDRLEEIARAHARAKVRLFVESVTSDFANGRPFQTYLELTRDAKSIRDLAFVSAASQYRLDMSSVYDTRPLTRRARPIFERFISSASDAIDIPETMRSKITFESSHATHQVFDQE